MDVPNLHVRSRAQNTPNPEPVDRPSPPCGADARPAACARQVIKLMQSFKSKEFVKAAFAWRHYYWRARGALLRGLRFLLSVPPC
jgi:hypothetical protein